MTNLNSVKTVTQESDRGELSLLFSGHNLCRNSRNTSQEPVVLSLSFTSTDCRRENCLPKEAVNPIASLPVPHKVH